MDEDEIERIAARVVEKLREPACLQDFARAIATELVRLDIRSRADLAKLGERLDKTYY